MATYIHPRVEVNTIDLSVVGTATNVNTGTGLFAVFNSEKGLDNKVKEITSTDEFIKEYGNPDYNTYGQAAFNCVNWLNNGGRVFALRALPYNATYATGVFAVEESSNKVHTSVFPISDTETIKKLNGIADPSSSTTEKLETSIESYITYKGDSQFMVFTPKARGKYYNKLAFSLNISTVFKGSLNFPVYEFYAFVKNGSTYTQVEGPIYGAMHPEAKSLNGNSFFLPDMVSDQSEYFTAFANKSEILSLYRRYASDYVSDTEVSSLDLLFFTQNLNTQFTVDAEEKAYTSSSALNIKSAIEGALEQKVRAFNTDLNLASNVYSAVRITDDGHTLIGFSNSKDSSVDYVEGATVLADRILVTAGQSGLSIAPLSNYTTATLYISATQMPAETQVSESDLKTGNAMFSEIVNLLDTNNGVFYGYVCTETETEGTYEISNLEISSPAYYMSKSVSMLDMNDNLSLPTLISNISANIVTGECGNVKLNKTTVYPVDRLSDIDADIERYKTIYSLTSNVALNYSKFTRFGSTAAKVKNIDGYVLEALDSLRQITLLSAYKIAAQGYGIGSSATLEGQLKKIKRYMIGVTSGIIPESVDSVPKYDDVVEVINYVQNNEATSDTEYNRELLLKEIAVLKTDNYLVSVNTAVGINKNTINYLIYNCNTNYILDTQDVAQSSNFDVSFGVASVIQQNIIGVVSVEDVKTKLSNEFSTLDTRAGSGSPLSQNAKIDMYGGTDGNIEDVINAIELGYLGELDDTVKDIKQYDFSVILDAGYAFETKSAIYSLITKYRDDVFAYIDCGSTVISSDKVYRTFGASNANLVSALKFDTGAEGSKDISIWPSYWKITDPYTGNTITVSDTYYLAMAIPNNDALNGIYKPLAGLDRGNISQFGAINPSFVPNAEDRTMLYQERVNYIVKDPRNTRIDTNLTSQVKDTALIFINNVRSIKKMRRDVEMVCDNFIHEFNDETTLKKMENAVNLNLAQWIDRNCSYIHATVYASPSDIVNKIARVKVELKFKGIIELIVVDMIIN